ncbi:MULTISPECIES: metallophosphoesterase family protein [Chitinophagaceae]
MKLAFISDIHANLSALTAALRDIKQHDPDHIYCLGDLVNFAGWDNPVIDLIRQQQISCVQGNHDEGIGYEHKDFAFSYSNEAQKHFGHLSILRVNKIITVSNRRFLADLPFMLQLEFRFGIHPIRLAMVHGSISSNNEYVQENTSDEYLLEMMGSINADILLMGHTHIPYHKAIFCEEENRKIYRHAINVGSIGKPKNGTVDACYCLLEFHHDETLDNPDTLQVSFHHVPYNTQEVIDRIKMDGMPDAYDDYLSNKQ